MFQVSVPAGSRLGLPVALVLGSLFYAAAGGLGWVALKIHRTGKAIEGWTETPARIERVEIVEQESGGSTTYSLECEYVYTWNGSEYRSDVISRTGMPGKIEELRPIHDRLAASRDTGAMVSAFVNPDAPSDSVLRRKVETAIILICTTIAGFFVVLPTAAIIAAYVKRPRA